MTSTDSTGDVDDAGIRATYEEYEVGDACIAMIADPDNAHAWIQSDVTEPVDP